MDFDGLISIPSGTIEASLLPGAVVCVAEFQFPPVRLKHEDLATLLATEPYFNSLRYD